ncbi:MAG: RluA family pseudouridine synthase [bacterium]|nr:RluA family pseudouridine synthase [bacterium]
MSLIIPLGMSTSMNPMSPVDPEGVVPDALSGERLDRVVALVWGCSRAEAARLIDQEKVEVNGSTAASRSQRLVPGDQIRLSEEPVMGQPSPGPDPDVELDVVYVDESVIVVNKPPGLVVHPGSGNAAGTLVNGLLARFPDIAEVGEPQRPGIVHRLDRGTSGLLMVALTQGSYDALTAALGRREVHRGYSALVVGMPPDDQGVIDAPVGRSTRHPTKMAVTADGRPARTHYQVTARMPASPEPPQESVPFDTAHLELQLETGRTHQIRVHLAAIGHPVLGDDLYGGPGAPDMSRPALHAHTLVFAHPGTGEQLRFQVDPPEDFSALYRLLCG